jgi:ABC-type glycerol-3-phosphate transport system substrate-binding protein
MRRMLGLAAAAAIAFSVSAASADEITGTVSNIDLTRATFMVDGRTFTASPTNTVGAKLEDLQEGDTVKLEVATQDLSTGKQPYNVMVLEKVE